MKILKLAFENLNSLYGKWEIDFEDANFTDAGIFAITGPTGAGKSTILDAICLALYGRSPRLESISQSTNEIMSKGSARCAAEVIFEAGGNNYICTWSQRRARDLVEGRLQNQRHELAALNSDGTAEIISNRIEEVKSKVAELTGMDFTRFTRSMLLAQGGFAAFLNAPPDEKAPILEQITGTELYSEISRKVHEIHRREESSLMNLKAQLDNEASDLINEEALAKMELELVAIKEQIVQLRAERDSYLLAAENIRAIARHQSQIEIIKAQQLRHQSDLVAFEEDKRRLEAGERALRVSSSYAVFENLKRGYTSDASNLQFARDQLSSALKLHEQTSTQYEAAQLALKRAEDEQLSLLSVTATVRQLDGKIDELKGRIAQIEAEIESVVATSKDRAQDLANVNDTLSLATLNKKNLEQYLEENSNDRSLQSQLSAIRVTFSNLTKEKDKVDAAKERRSRALDLHRIASEREALARAQLADSGDQLDRLRQNEGLRRSELVDLLDRRSRREIEAEREALQRELMLIDSVEELKAKRELLLIPGHACPLCGSIEHPFSDGIDLEGGQFASAKLVEITALLEKVDQLSEEIEEFESAVTDAKTRHVQLQADLSLAAARLDDSKLDLDHQEALLDESEAEYLAVSENFQQIIRPYLTDSNESIDQASFDSIDTYLSERASRFSEASSKISQLNEEIAILRTRISHLDESRQRDDETLSLLTRRRSEEFEALGSVTGERSTLFGEEDVVEAEKMAQRKVEEAALDHTNLATARAASSDRISHLNGQIETLEANLGRIEAEIEIASAAVIKSLAAEGFTDEEDYLSSRLSQEELDELKGRSEELASTSLTLLSQLQSQSESLSRIEKLLTNDDTLEATQGKIDELDAQINALQLDDSTIRAQIEANEVLRLRYQSLFDEFELRQRQFKRWQDLDKLIGSADGKKFRNFVQTLTFESLVRGANQQLRIMSDRYLLLADSRPGQRLTLNVVDNYQAGEVRTTKNLSGGESFIVSLALALGLSNMLSGRNAVDSLFLDEGFGTLDEEALEAAIDALSNLKGHKKLVGIISHVQSLKDRISTQVVVSPMVGGRSTISGPGCRSLS